MRVWIFVCLFLLPGFSVFGQGDPAFYMGNARTGEKPQSKVWFHDGAWWCILAGTVSGKTAHRIYRFGGTNWELVNSRQQVVDAREGARADVLSVEDELFVLSFHPRQTRFLAFDYDDKFKQYVMRKGFPVVISHLSLTGIETMVLEREGSGRFWAIF